MIPVPPGCGFPERTIMLSRRGFCVLLPGAAGWVKDAVASAPARGGGDEWSFAEPPESARPYVLWMWMGSNISKAGITRDLEGMKAAGIGGATIFSLSDSTVPWAGVILKSPTPEIVTFTDPWWAMVRYAAEQAHRLGLELILHNCAGYESSGGPWVTPELSMQEVVWSSTAVKGGAVFHGALPKAKVDLHPHAQFPKVFIPSLGRIGIPTVEARQSFYKDIAVVAVPASGVAAKGALIDLTERMSEVGELDWEVPTGEWVVYRFGHTTTGAMIQPAQWDAMGLECDKMSKEAVTFHVRHVLGEMKKHLGDMMGKGVTTLYFDSYEAGTPTWTPKMREEFHTRRGYDIVPWLPVLAGRVVGSEAETAGFKKDLRRTQEDLYRDHYWATPGPLAHEAGVKFVAEPYDGPWRIDEVVKFLDVPVVEFWTHKNVYSPSSVEPVVKAARAMGSRLIGAESFTTSAELARWNETPAWLKPIGDAAFCDGVNRVNLHHFVQQPWGEQYKPGNVMGQWGVHFGRNQTWWEPGKAWLKYLWRCQNLLQRGDFVANAQPTLTVNATGPTMKSIHRRDGAKEIYFVANVARVGGTVRCAFPVSGLQPELLDPVWGTTRAIEDYEHTSEGVSFSLEFAAAQSFFVVFRRPAAARRARQDRVTRVVVELDGSWKVAFDPKWGGPASVEFDRLVDWTTHSDAGIRYFSGSAVYRKSVHLARVPRGGAVWLELGDVKHLAEVTVNGKRLGVVWTAPWRVDAGKALRAGENTIEIAVTNVWANRLIGDEQHPADMVWEVGDAGVSSGQVLKEFPDWFLKGEARPVKERVTFTTWNYFKKDSPLIPSGLMGPVRLVAEG